MDNAALIWKTLHQRFHQPNESKILNLQHMLSMITQGTNSVDAYFTQLYGVWEELRNYRPLPHCSCGKCNVECFAKFIDIQEQDYVLHFLSGLNETHESVVS